MIDYMAELCFYHYLCGTSRDWQLHGALQADTETTRWNIISRQTTTISLSVYHLWTVSHAETVKGTMLHPFWHENLYKSTISGNRIFIVITKNVSVLITQRHNSFCSINLSALLDSCAIPGFVTNYQR